MQRKKRRKLNPYLKVSYALLTLIVLLALTAVVLWRAEQQAPKENAAQLQQQNTVLHQGDTQLQQDHAATAEQVAIKQETTLYDGTVQEETAGEGTVIAPQSGILIAGDDATEDDADAADTPEDTAAANEADTAEQPVPAAQRTGRVIFVGDSRTIDLFADSNEPIDGVMRDGILIYARHAHRFGYLESVVQSLSLTSDDILVTWMGANDDGVFSSYRGLYQNLLQRGVGLVVCTVGPTADAHLNEWDIPYYTNGRMQAFNSELLSFAAANGVPVIDLYSYIVQYVQIDTADGIHYLPRPDPALWSYILENLRAYTG